MCGIAGFCDFQNNFTKDEFTSQKWQNVLINMRNAIIHRGKDESGEFLRKNIGLAHSRLSIRDLYMGRQPLIRNLNYDYAIVYNGEIYNTDELKNELLSAGFSFQTSTDTEVILYCYINYGADFVKKLNGIFSFAIWDGKLSRLLLYRDRVGVKPLFYTLSGSSLIFGSEIKALFSYPKVSPTLDIDSFRQVFGLGPARKGGSGVFKDIFEINSGCYAIFDEKGFKSYRYWDLKSKEHTDSYQKTLETTAFLVKDAINRQMVSDVPICSFLSGGIDSSIVTKIASDYLSESGKTLNTFSFDFTGNDKNFISNSFQPEQDRPYVDIMLKNINSNHTYLECDKTDLVDLLKVAVIAKDLPGMADIDSSLLYFCNKVSQKNKVALTGECADEIFGGYPWFYREDLLTGYGFPWSKNIDVRQSLLNDNIIKKLELTDYTSGVYEDAIKEVDVLKSEPKLEQDRRKIAYLNLKWFMQTLLDRMDRASMYCGLEARVPFADHRIVEYIFNVPWEMKYKEGVEKHLLRHAFKDIVPSQVLFRKKSPYPKIYDPAYGNLLKERFIEVISSPYAPINQFLDNKKATEFLLDPLEYGKPWFGQLMAGPQLIAYYLQINYWLEIYKPLIIL
ncbi:asparagine synthase (glutamine-hydrolyzing) [bacterium]|nr:asparagine synthase (glutamine-hydrolyzing) [bacterium]